MSVSNLGPIGALTWSPSETVNVIIGANASGKTLLLKVLWAMVRSRESWRRGDDPRTYREILADKLYWTFQIPKLGHLVRRGQDERMAVTIEERDSEGGTTSGVSLSRRAERGLGEVIEPSRSSAIDSVFVPAKEVLSIATQVKQARLAKQFGFDEPTTDLVALLERAPTRGAPKFGRARRDMEMLVGGRIDLEDDRWTLVSGDLRIPVAIAAEGHKKLAIFDRLIVNRTLREGSVLFIDEPESFLHPEALLRFLKVVLRLGQNGVQVFLATHSLFALNVLRLHAAAGVGSISALSLLHADVVVTSRCDDLAAGMPPNDLTAAAIHLYELEMMGSLDA